MPAIDRSLSNDCRYMKDQTEEEILWQQKNGRASPVAFESEDQNPYGTSAKFTILSGRFTVLSAQSTVLRANPLMFSTDV